MTDSINVIPDKTEDLDAETRDAIIHLCVAAYQDEDFKNLFFYIPSGGLHLLGYRHERLVSHAVVTTRWLQPQGLPKLKTAYLDAVATLPGDQGQGYGSRLMCQLAREIEDEYVIGCLEAAQPFFYERLGWELWRGPLAGRGEQGLIPTPEQKGIMILQLPDTPALDLDQRLTIECQRERIW